MSKANTSCMEKKREPKPKYAVVKLISNDEFGDNLYCKVYKTYEKAYRQMESDYEENIDLWQDEPDYNIGDYWARVCTCGYPDDKILWEIKEVYIH